MQELLFPAEDNMRICPYCSAELDDKAKFCPMCGGSLGEDPTKREEKEEEQKTWDQTRSGDQAFYSQTPYSQSAQAYQPQSTNGFAIAGFVLSFFIPILGIIFSAIALKQIPERNEGGKGLAIAGLVLSIVWLSIILILLLTGACAFSTLYYYL